MRKEDIPYKFEGQYEDITLINAINDLLKDYPQMEDLCLESGFPKPGILFITGQTELNSLGLLDEILDEDISIRIVPILHGG